MKYYKYKMEKEYKTIYYFLKEQGFSENYISNLRKDIGNFKLNGDTTTIRSPLKKDDILEINCSPNKKTTIMHCILPLDVVFCDEYYLLINKPANISCMPNKSHYNFNIAGAICNYMKDKDENFVLRMINRLDKDTSGLILVALDSIAQNKVKDVKKVYHALCNGKIDRDLIIDKKIKTITKNGINELKRVVDESGQNATTFVHPLKYNDNFSLLQIELLNGRTHQIRVHLSSEGHPLVGDELYGEKSPLINHTALICKKFSFYHPFKKQTLEFEIDYPNDFKELIQKAFS